MKSVEVINEQTQPIPLVMAPLLPLAIANRTITPSKLLAHNHGKWVTAPDEKPGYILVGVNTKTLTHHQLKVKKRKGSRVKVEYVLTDFKKKPWDILVFKEQYECKKNKSRFRLLSEDEWRDWKPIKKELILKLQKKKPAQSSLIENSTCNR